MHNFSCDIFRDGSLNDCFQLHKYKYLFDDKYRRPEVSPGVNQKVPGDTVRLPTAVSVRRMQYHTRFVMPVQTVPVCVILYIEELFVNCFEVRYGFPPSCRSGLDPESRKVSGILRKQSENVLRI